MKKDIAKQLNAFAEKLPCVWDEKIDWVPMTGYEMNLTPYGDIQRYDPNGMYQVQVPMYVAVCHKQQIKDAYKAGGISAVKNYFDSVMAKYTHNGDLERN